MNQLSLTFAIDCSNETRVLLPSPAGRRVGDEGLATKEKTANPVLQLETSESDGTGYLMQALARLKFSPIIAPHFQRNERSQALSGWLSVGSIDRTGARIESTTDAGREPALATTSQSTAAGLQIPAPASIRWLCRRLLLPRSVSGSGM